jgi:CRISPR-associated protein Csm4
VYSMARYELHIKPVSPFQTALQSDTIFGHICWAVRYLWGEAILEEFLSAYTKKYAPLVLSSGIPKGYVPMPILPPLTINEEEMLFERYYVKRSRLEFGKELKGLKKINYIPLNTFKSFQAKLSYFNLYEAIISRNVLPEFIGKEFQKDVEVWHNGINRLSGKVITGRLFAKTDTFFAREAEYVVFLADGYFGKERVEKIFEFVSRGGYGADKSSGKGLFSFELEQAWCLPETQNPNGFMTLSNYSPAKGDFTDGYYRLLTKFGKLGGHWASGNNPFKRPITFCAPGSFFQTDTIKPFYGGLIPKVHRTNEKIVQYACALPLAGRMVCEQ